MIFTVDVVGRKKEVSTWFEYSVHFREDLQSAIVVHHADTVHGKEYHLEGVVIELFQFACIALFESTARIFLATYLDHFFHIIHSQVVLADIQEWTHRTPTANTKVENGVVFIDRDVLQCRSFRWGKAFDFSILRCRAGHGGSVDPVNLVFHSTIVFPESRIGFPADDKNHGNSSINSCFV